MFENRQVEGLFNSPLDFLFKSRLDELFEYKRKAPISYKRREWVKYLTKTKGIGIMTLIVKDPSKWHYPGSKDFIRIDNPDGSFYFKTTETESDCFDIFKENLKNVVKYEFSYKTFFTDNDSGLYLYVETETMNTNLDYGRDDDGTITTSNSNWTYFSRSVDKPVDIRTFDLYACLNNKDDYVMLKNIKFYFKEKTTIYIKDFKLQIFNGFNVKSKIKKDYKNIKVDFLYQITKYSNDKTKITYKITPYVNVKDTFQYPITYYKNLQNYVFYRIGYDNPPPKRVIIKDLDDS